MLRKKIDLLLERARRLIEQDVSELDYDRILGQLEQMEAGLVRFIERADRPLEAADELFDVVSRVADRFEAGEELSRREVSEIGTAISKMSAELNSTYGFFVRMREALYRFAELIGKSTRRPTVRRPGAKPVERMHFDELLQGIRAALNGLFGGIRSILEVAAGTLREVRATADRIKAGEKPTVEELSDLVDIALDFRDLLGQEYYAPLGGLVRRYNEIMRRFGERQFLAPEFEEQYLLLPWEKLLTEDLLTETKILKINIQGIGLWRVPRGLKEKEILQVPEYDWKLVKFFYGKYTMRDAIERLRKYMEQDWDTYVVAVISGDRAEAQVISPWKS